MEEIQNKYLYIANSTFISKYCIDNSIKYKTKKYDYLPIINTSGKDINELANSKFMIYLKCVKLNKSSKAGYFGYFTGEHILINNNIKQQHKIKSSDDIKVDDLLYRIMIQNYSLCELPNLVFIKYDTVIPFNNLITPTKFGEICKKNNFQSEKISTKLNCLNVVNYNIDEPIDYIEREFENEEEEDDEKENEEENEKNGKDEEEDINVVVMNIPIVWNPCNEIIDKMENMDIKKKDILEHYKKCDICEVVDNNRIAINFDNKKINLHIKQNEEDTNFINKIIDDYQLTKKYIEKNNLFEDFGLEENKINIIYYKCEGELYNNSFFIISK